MALRHATRYAHRMIAHTIQLALAPVFVLVAIGNILNVLSGRLSRIVDRSRLLQGAHAETDGPDHDYIVAQMRALDRRIVLNTSAHLALVIAGLMIGLTVVALFVDEVAGLNFSRVAAALFILAIAMLMWALVLFLRETQIAAQTLRVPHSFLEAHRSL